MEVIVIPADMQEFKKNREDWNNPVAKMPTNTYRIHNGQIIRGQYSCVEECEGISEFCLDVGVCTLCSQDVYEFIIGLGDKLKAVVFHDNDGYEESKHLPFSHVVASRSITDWSRVVLALRKINFDGMLIFDFGENLFSLPTTLRKTYMEYAREVAGYFSWQIELEKKIKQYDKRVLFGAGNMCRNYMKNYGQDFAPLYTCDNNSSIWGSDFEGLKIHSPEDLKSLDKDVAIFICNIYYEEISKQLRDMGITNPIEYFSDEYMPTLCTDRFDSKDRTIKK